MPPGHVAFPASLDTRDTLLRLGLGTETFLRQPFGVNDTFLVIDNTSLISEPTGVLIVGNEWVTYNGISGNTLTVSERGAFQEFGGYQAYDHHDSDRVSQRILPIHHQVLSDAIIAIEEYVLTFGLGPFGLVDWDVDDLQTGNSIFWNDTTNRWISYTPYFGDEANTGSLWSATNGQVPSYNTATSQWVPVTVSMPGHTHTAANVTDFTEAAQDVIGALLVDSTSIDYTYNDAGNAMTVAVKYGGSGGDYGSAATVARSDHTHIALVPTGGIIEWALSTAPSGWALCDGAEVLRSSTLGALLVADGMKYGTGNGTTTVNLPNLKGRVPVGRDAAQTEFDTLGETGGAKTHTLTAAESGVPAHDHAVSITSGSNSASHSHSQYQFQTNNNTQTGGGANRLQAVSAATGGSSTGTQSANHTHLVSGNTQDNVAADAASAHTNLQPYLVTNFIIKL